MVTKKIRQNVDGTVVEEWFEKNGVRHGLARILDGETAIGETTYEDGKLHGRCRTWYSNGTLREESYYNSGERDGTYVSYWKNGGKKEEGCYSMGDRVGLYRWFDMEGNIVKEHSY